MATFQVTITDPGQLAGITAAREAANASLTPERDDKGDAKAINTHPSYIATDAAYVQAVMSSASLSYAKSYGVHEPTLLAEETAVAVKRARFEASK